MTFDENIVYVGRLSRFDSSKVIARVASRSPVLIIFTAV